MYVMSNPWGWLHEQREIDRERQARLHDERLEEKKRGKSTGPQSPITSHPAPASGDGGATLQSMSSSLQTAGRVVTDPLSDPASG